MRQLGRAIHPRVRLEERFQSFYTRFLRNRAQLRLIAGLCKTRPMGQALKIVSLGCSTGAEVYSLLNAIRSIRADLAIEAVGIDFSKAAIEKAKQGVYAYWDEELKGLSPKEMDALFYDQSGFKVVQDHLRQGVSWRVADICDSAQLRGLDSQDVVLINNLLIHLEAPKAEPCLQHIVRLVAPGGLLVLSGIDMDLKERVMLRSELLPITDMIREVHNGDPQVLDDWPFRYWGLEPLDPKRAGWHYRYSTVFQARV